MIGASDILSVGLDGHVHSLGALLFAWEQRLRKLPSQREWMRANGWPEVKRRGRLPGAGHRAYRRHFRVLTPRLFWRFRW